MVMNAERGGYVLIDKQAEGYDEWSYSKDNQERTEETSVQ